MKTLLLLRHAKTEPGSPDGDWHRTLTERGKRDAAVMGEMLASIAPDLERIITSDARRARQTAVIVARKSGYERSLKVDKRLYGADPDELLDVVWRTSDKLSSIMLIGHNPGLEELAAELGGPEAPSAHLPTSGLVHLEFDVEQWRDIKPAAGKLRAIYTPKESRSNDKH